MTLEEKLGQMSQTPFPSAMSDKFKEELRKGRWGSFLNGGTLQQKAEAQRIALKESRLGIPILYGQDVIHGFDTIFPIPLGSAATWDADLVRQAARVAAREASAAGIHWTFSPMMDIARDPRWGRIAECLGEDPYLAGVLAAAMIRGYQGDKLDAVDSIAACAKHYVGYGAAEGGRDYNTTWIPENLLREVYLKPFEAARRAGVATYMSAFNSLNGVPTSANEFTLKQVLRNEWGFDGFVVSDYESVRELIPHGFAADEADAARRAIRAGVDMEMVSTTYFRHAKSLLDAQQIDMKQLDDAARNILRVKYRLGLFDGRVQPTAPRPATPPAEFLDIARRLARESLVLLKNTNSALPLNKSVGKVAVIGPLANSVVDQLGTWTLGGNRSAVRTPLTAIREQLGEQRVKWSPGLRNSRDTSHEGFADAVKAASASDTVLLFLGEEQSLSGEASSRAYLNLPGGQEELVAEIAKTGKPLIVVILAGRPLTFHDVAEKAAAVLYAWHPGTTGGPAIADVLFGAEAPSGRLPVTFPRTVGQVPIYYNHMSTGRPASETGPGAANKFTSKYLDAGFTPEYPFGYGLSYTSFSYSTPKLSAATIALGASIKVSAEVTNTGKYPATEIVQLYTRQLSASTTRPVRELRDFRRLLLKPGEKQAVEFTLNAAGLAFFNPQGKWAAEPGTIHVWISPDSASGQPAVFELTR